jgi:translation initiation factor IF-1
MVNTDKIEVEGIVIEILGGWYYKIDLWNWMYVMAKPAWKLRKNNIKIIVGDKVKVELNEYDPSKWRITYRLSWKKKMEDN